MKEQNIVAEATELTGTTHTEDTSIEDLSTENEDTSTAENTAADEENEETEKKVATEDEDTEQETEEETTGGGFKSKLKKFFKPSKKTPKPVTPPPKNCNWHGLERFSHALDEFSKKLAKGFFGAIVLYCLLHITVYCYPEAETALHTVINVYDGMAGLVEYFFWFCFKLIGSLFAGNADFLSEAGEKLKAGWEIFWTWLQTF